MFVLDIILILSFVNSTVYPLSQNVPRDSNALFLISGNICACFTSEGRWGKHNSPFLVEVICLPSGSVTLRGSQVCAFTCGVLLEMYVAVQPESAIA